MYLNSVSRWCPENVAGERLQTRWSRHRFPLREHLNNVHGVQRKCREVVFPDTVKRHMVSMFEKRKGNDHDQEPLTKTCYTYGQGPLKFL